MAKTNKYSADCEICGQTVQAGEGELEKSEFGWQVTHPECREAVETASAEIAEQVEGLNTREMKKIMRPEMREMQERIDQAEQEKVDAINAIEDSKQRLAVSNGAQHPVVDEKRAAEQKITLEQNIRQRAWDAVIYDV
jgi:ssDNA-binding Zn-finger/Zn-ribbon topoisomerase 1